jgi:hypothetical protein
MERREQEPRRPLAQILSEASTEIAGKEIRYDQVTLNSILSPRHFVVVRQTFGGPAPRETLRAAAISRDYLEADERWALDANEAIDKSRRTLEERSAAI